MEVWHAWVCLAIILFILEVISFSFIWSSLATGCLFSATVAFWGLSIDYQLLSFSLGVTLSFIFVRPLILGKRSRSNKDIKTNVDALIGKEAEVLITIDHKINAGRVVVDGVDWKAVAINKEFIHVGEKVEILKVNSTILIVKPKP